MRKKILALGVLSMAMLAGEANAQALALAFYTKPDSTNTNKLSACEIEQGFYQLMTGTRASLAVNFRNAGASATSTLSTSWKDTLFADTNNGVGTRAVYKTGDAATDITTRALIADFDVRMSYRNTDNSGFFYRGKATSNPPWQTGIEVGIDNTNSRTPREQTGSVFDIFPPVPQQSQTTFLYNSNRWNEIRVIAIGDSIQHWVNGTKVADYKMFSTAYFSGVGSVNNGSGAVTTGYNTSKWGSGKTMSFDTAGKQSAGPILRGILGVQGAHPGNMIIRNLRVDTIPSWGMNGAHYPDSNLSFTGTTCGGGTSIRKLGGGVSKTPIRVSYSANKTTIFIPEGGLQEASLVDAFGRARSSARIQGHYAEFDKVDNGVYFLRYRNAFGTYSARISLVGMR